MMGFNPGEVDDNSRPSGSMLEGAEAAANNSTMEGVRK